MLLQYTEFLVFKIMCYLDINKSEILTLKENPKSNIKTGDIKVKKKYPGNM